jgi:glutamine amidotransferase
MITIVDYGMGNLRSVQKALQKVGSDAVITSDPDTVRSADRLILPGVGAFGDAMEQLRARGLVEPVAGFIASGKPFLGICLGMQLLFEWGEEDGGHAGLGVLRGKVLRFQPTDPALKVPHMGWNALQWTRDDPVLAGLKPGCCVYFVHGYHVAPADPSIVAATTDYGGPFCSCVRRGNVFATQFHPEKSQKVGLKLLANFAA